MTTWIVGDVHGRPRVLERLLAEIAPDPSADRLWFVGDLVNRGPDSLGALRLVWDLARRFGSRFACVLGNHDLHLLTAAEGLRAPGDDLAPIFDAPGRDELLRWLRRRPLAHREAGCLLVHGGLWPDWSVGDALVAAARVESALRDPERRKELLDLGPRRERADGTGSLDDLEVPPAPELAHDLYAFVSLRMLQGPEGDATAGPVPCKHIPCKHKGPPEDAPAGCVPWFDVPGRRSAGHLVVFGHWAALGVRQGDDWVCVDAGCAWDRGLAALSLEGRTVVHVEDPDAH